MPFSCFLFRPRKSREKRRKRNHTNVSSTLSTRSSTPPAQTPHVRFHSRKRVHTRFSEKDCAQGLTRRNTGCFGWGWYHYPRSVPRVLKTLRGRGLERQTLPLLGLGWMCSPKTQKACGTAMRLCASLFRRRRGPAGLRDLFSFLSKLRFSHPALRAFRAYERGGGITTPGVLCVLLKRWTVACQNGSFAAF